MRGRGWNCFLRWRRRGLGHHHRRGHLRRRPLHPPLGCPLSPWRRRTSWKPRCRGRLCGRSSRPSSAVETMRAAMSEVRKGEEIDSNFFITSALSPPPPPHGLALLERCLGLGLGLYLRQQGRCSKGPFQCPLPCPFLPPPSSPSPQLQPS